MKETHKDQLNKLCKPKQLKGTTTMVARIKRERENGRTISGRGQVRASAFNALYILVMTQACIGIGLLMLTLKEKLI